MVAITAGIQRPRNTDTPSLKPGGHGGERPLMTLSGHRRLFKADGADEITVAASAPPERGLNSNDLNPGSPDDYDGSILAALERN